MHVVDFFLGRKQRNAHVADKDGAPAHGWMRVRVVVDIALPDANNLTFVDVPMMELMPIQSARMNANVLDFTGRVVEGKLRITFRPEEGAALLFEV